MFLKQERFEFNGQSVMLNELSALQRINYLEYLAGEEKALAASGEEQSENAMTTRLIGMSIRNSARLIAYSLWHNEPSGPSEDELFHQVLSTWPAQAVGQAEMQVKMLSGMVSPVVDKEHTPEEDAGETASVDEPITAEKP